MKIHVESLGLPTLAKLIGRKTEFAITDGKGTVADLIALILSKYGQKAAKILLDPKGELDMTIQVMINEEGFVPREDYTRRTLKEGDQVKFMLLVGGG